MRRRYTNRIMLALIALSTSASQIAVAADTTTSTQAPSKEESSSSLKPNEPCKISCVNPHTCCAESEKVLEVLQTLVKAYSSGDLKTYEEYLDEHCTTFCENTHKFISGKANVLNDMKTKFEKYAPGGPTPLVSFTIDQPYAKVTGDTAVVTFIAFREIGGKHPYKEKSSVTDVFVKHNGTWKKLHYRGAWKKVNA